MHGPFVMFYFVRKQEIGKNASDFSCCEHGKVAVHNIAFGRKKLVSIYNDTFLVNRNNLGLRYLTVTVELKSTTSR